MNIRNLANLISLGVIWGLSFLLVRVAAPEFGAVALIEVRVLAAAMVLLPLVVLHRQLAEIRANWRPIFVMGVLHYALPFALFAYSMLTLGSGYSAIINASSPIFACVAAWAWLGERPQAGRLTGLVVGLTGVAILVSDKLAAGNGSVVLAVGAAVLASAFYGIAAVLAKKHLSGISPVAVSGGSMLASALVLLPASLWLWPQTDPTVEAWSTALALGVGCTAAAFVLYFRLITNIGPTRAITVTLLIPVFAVIFGAIFIDESITGTMIAGGLTILFGTAMALGLFDVTSLIRRINTSVARVGMLALITFALSDIPTDVHADDDVEGWQFSTPVYVAANSFYSKPAGQSDSFTTLAASMELLVSSASRPWSANLFAEHHLSQDVRVNETWFVGGQYSYYFQRWDAAAFLFAAQFPGNPTEAAYAGRIRRLIGNGHKIGAEYLAYDKQGSSELKLAYYVSFVNALTFKLTAGSRMNDGWEPVARFELSWQIR